MRPVAGAVALRRTHCAVHMCVQGPVQVLWSKSTPPEAFFVCVNHTRHIQNGLDSKRDAGACTTS
ncbi:unnamed protein product, partial [Ectocarpus sp. 8 AP-2014]